MTINRLLCAAALAVPLGAAALPALGTTPAAAQSHDIEVMVDERGRRVLIDTRTGEFLGYAGQRGARQRRGSMLDRLLDRLDGDPVVERRRRQRRARGGDGFFLDEMEERRARRQARREGREARRRAERERAERQRAERLEAERNRQTASRGVDRAPAAGYGAPADDFTTGSVAAAPARRAPVQSRVTPKMSRAVVAKLQILLDREGFSPGAIDGRMGSNVRKAVEAWTRANPMGGDLYDAAALDRHLARMGAPFTTYEIRTSDLDRPFIASVPVDYAEKAKLESLAYTSPIEMLAERFHTSQTYLRELNPRANFFRAGTVLTVPHVGAPVTEKVHYIVADKGLKQLRAYDRNGELTAAYPATIGSASTPSPSGTVEVARVALDPEYTYNPKINFTQGNNTQILRIPPGPNGPVGSVWIALSKKTYGIHGTPDPERIGKTNSHGCIRLTNWDARELAKLVAKGVTVEFVE